MLASLTETAIFALTDKEMQISYSMNIDMTTRGLLTLFFFLGGGGGEGGDTPLYGLYRYVRPQRVWFFNRFGNKYGIDFCTLVLNSFFFRRSYFTATVYVPQLLVIRWTPGAFEPKLTRQYQIINRVSNFWSGHK